MSIHAFIFDLDGVITDTAIYHFEAWQRMAHKLGIVFTQDDNEALKGVSRRGSINMILAKANRTLPEAEIERLMHEKNEDYKKLIEHITPGQVFNGVLPLLNELRMRDIRIGLASASKNARAILARLALLDAFDYIADAAQITNGKPAPDIFLDVMHAFDCQPAQCIGIEDAVAGIEAIHAANMFAIGIGDPLVLHEADIVFPDMASFDLDSVLTCASH